jgi:hypothetical protein
MIGVTEVDLTHTDIIPVISTSPNMAALRIFENVRKKIVYTLTL